MTDVLEVYPRLFTNARGFDAMLAFYRDGLGLVPAKVLPGRYASFDLGELTALAVIAGDLDGIAHPTGSGADRQMVVLRVTDVDACTERAVTHGGTVVTAPADRDHGLRSAHYRDPDGNLVELQSY